ncbi:MAG: ABC transporter permease [Anaerolineae bacterium]
MIGKRLNPIIIREMRGRMRGNRAFVVLTVYLTLLSCLVGSMYAFIYSENANSSYYNYNITAPNVQYGPVMGKAIFVGTTLLLLAIISLIAPAFTAGAIAGERERKTYEILVITPMSAGRIILGKLGAVLTFLLLLILASLPIQSLAFLFGGVALIEMVIAAGGLLVTALAFGALGLFISSLARTTMSAIIAAYSIVIPFIYGLPFVLLLVVSILSGSMVSIFDNPPLITLLLLIYGGGFLASINPFSSAVLTGVAAADGRGYFLFKETVEQVTVWLVSPWLVYVLFYSLLAVVLILLTIRRESRIRNT